MGRALKFLIFLAVLGGMVIVGNAIFSELEPETKEVVVPIEPAIE